MLSCHLWSSSLTCGQFFHMKSCLLLHSLIWVRSPFFIIHYRDCWKSATWKNNMFIFLGFPPYHYKCFPLGFQRFSAQISSQNLQYHRGDDSNISKGRDGTERKFLKPHFKKDIQVWNKREKSIMFRDKTMCQRTQSCKYVDLCQCINVYIHPQSWQLKSVGVFKQRSNKMALWFVKL